MLQSRTCTRSRRQPRSAGPRRRAGYTPGTPPRPLQRGPAPRPLQRGHAPRPRLQCGSSALLSVLKITDVITAAVLLGIAVTLNTISFTTNLEISFTFSCHVKNKNKTLMTQSSPNKVFATWSYWLICSSLTRNLSLSLSCWPGSHTASSPMSRFWLMNL